MHSKSILWIRIVTGVLMASVNAWGASPAEQVVFSGRFTWKTNRASPLKLVITRAKLNATGSAPGNPLRVARAEIWSTKLEASCSLVGMEKMDDRSSAIQLVCRSARLGALASPVTLFVTPESAPTVQSSVAGTVLARQKRPAFVRFGTWLEGYEQAQVTIDLDRTTGLMPDSKNRDDHKLKLAQR